MQFLIDNIHLVALMLVSGSILIWPLISKVAFGQNEVGTLEATRLINNNALVLDVREDHEYAVGHIPKSRHIPLSQLPARLNEIAKFKDKPILVNCRAGMRSSQATRILRKNAFSQIYQIKGGIGAWEEANLPLERSAK